MSTKKELNAARAELTELRRMLARIFPTGNNKYPHALWKQVRRLSDYAQWLTELSTPMPSRPTGISGSVNVDHEEAPAGAAVGGRSAEQPIIAGVRLSDRKHDRNLYHAGYEYEAELQRLTNALKQLIDQSADWIRGLDRDPVSLPSKRRPTCGCGEVMATTWRYCPYCSTAR